MRPGLSAALAAPVEARCALAVRAVPLTAASLHGAEGAILATRAVDGVVEDVDSRPFGFAQTEQGQHEGPAHQPPGVERAEFLLTIGYGLPRGP